MQKKLDISNDELEAEFEFTQIKGGPGIGTDVRKKS